MSLTAQLRRALRYACGRVDEEVIYLYCRKTQGQGKTDPCIEHYRADRRPPPVRRDRLISIGGRLSYRLMAHRLARKGAHLLCLVQDEDIRAFGWVQPRFGRRYDWLTENVIVLGPYWTHPAYRGRGLYGRLLAHSIAVCSELEDVPALICTRPDNMASRRGIEKAGFARLGTYRIVAFCFDLLSRGRPVSVERPLAEALRQCL